MVGTQGGALVLGCTSVALLSIWLLVWYLPPSTTPTGLVPAARCQRIQGYLAHKKQRPPLGPP